MSVLRELLFNVAKHAGTNRAEVRLRSVRGGVRVVVRDEGVGFDPVGSGKEEGEGTGGIGLRTVLEQVGTMGGEVEIQSSPGEGARIEIYLPGSNGS